MLVTQARGEQMAAARISRLHGFRGERMGLNMPKSCVGCGQCCGRVIPIDMEDVRRIERYATRHHLEPTDNNIGGPSGMEHMCGWFDLESGLCRIYPARPKVCRCWGSPHDGPLFGTRPGQPCGLRVDMMGIFLKHSELGDYDTWKSEWYLFEDDTEYERQ